MNCHLVVESDHPKKPSLEFRYRTLEPVPIVLLWLRTNRALNDPDAPFLLEIGPLPEHLCLEVLGEPVIGHSARILQVLGRSDRSLSRSM